MSSIITTDNLVSDSLPGHTSRTLTSFDPVVMAEYGYVYVLLEE